MNFNSNERVNDLKSKADGLGEKYTKFHKADKAISEKLAATWRRQMVRAGKLPEGTTRNPPLPPITHNLMKEREPSAWEQAKNAQKSSGGGGSWDRGGGSSWNNSWSR